MDKKTYYFDYNATTPLASEAYHAMEPYLIDCFGNPSSFHSAGKQAARAIRQARRKIASFLGAADENEIVFTSGGTESNNAAIRSALAANPEKKEVVTTSVEHSSVYQLFLQLERQGYRVHWLKVDAGGRIDFSELNDVLSDQTALVSVMMANNETGVLFPVDEIGEIIKGRGVLFHVDAVQAAGKIPIQLKNLKVDYLSLAAHKLYGPKGTGALYLHDSVPFQPLILGGPQERGRRAGTENVAGIVGLGAACEVLAKGGMEEMERLTGIRDCFETRLVEKIPGIFINAAGADRLPNTSNIRFQDVDGEALLIDLDQKGVYASSGSACMSGSREPSRVLKAMGLSDEEANVSLRFSFGRFTTQAEIEEGADRISESVRRLREIPLERQHTHA